MNQALNSYLLALKKKVEQSRQQEPAEYVAAARRATFDEPGFGGRPEIQQKMQMIEQITSAFAVGSFDKALAILETTLDQSPDDPDLSVLDEIARRQIEAAKETNDLLWRIKDLRARGRLDEAADLLRRALKSDERNESIRNALVAIYLEQAYSSVAAHWRKAEQFVAAASELDAEHPDIAHVRCRIVEARRKDQLNWWIARIYEHRRSGDLPEALRSATQALTEFPTDLRLQSLLHSLQEAVEESERSRSATTTSDERRSSLRRLVNDAAERFALMVRPVVSSPAKRIAGMLVVCLAYFAVARLGNFWPFTPSQPSTGRRVAKAGAPNAKGFEVSFGLAPAKLKLNVDGRDVAGDRLELTAGEHLVSASMPGYQTTKQTVTVGENSTRFQLALLPAPTSVRFESNLKMAISLDDKQGSETIELPSDDREHSASLSSPSGTIRVTFRTKIAAPPELVQIQTSNNLSAVALTTYQNQATIYAIPRSLPVRVAGASKGTASSKGLAVRGIPNDSQQEVIVGKGKQERRFSLRSIDAPALQIVVIGETTLGSILVTADQNDADVWYNNVPAQGRIQNGRYPITQLNPGEYSIRVSKPNFCVSPAAATVRVRAGEQTYADFKFQTYPILRVEGTPSEGKVFVDGNPVTSFDNISNLNPGTHSVTVSVGQQSVSKTVQLSCGTVTEFHVPDQFIKQPPPRVQRPQLITSVTPANAKLKIFKIGSDNNEVLVAENAPSVAELDPGMYRLRASLDGYTDADTTMALQAGEIKRATLSLNPIQGPGFEAKSAIQPTNAETTVPSAPLHISSKLAEANLIKRVDPAYPALAKSAHIQGRVQLTARINRQGNVEDLQVVSGNPLLAEAAKQAVLGWKYNPTLVNGQPVSVIADITVAFTLPR